MTNRAIRSIGSLSTGDLHSTGEDYSSGFNGDAENLTPRSKTRSVANVFPSENSGFVYRFGGFTLIPAQSMLLYAERPVRIGSRALAILVRLLEKSGELISSEDIFDRVWPGIFVEPNNLRVHMAALRKVLEEHSPSSRFIINIPGRGYRFVAAVEVAPLDAREPGAVPKPSGLPRPSTSLIGRDAVVDALERQLTLSRLLTIVGPGGIGKTRMALASVTRFVKNGISSACFVDLASLTDPQLVPQAIAQALRLSVVGTDALTDLTGQLRNQSLVIILDNCEHLIGAIADTAESILLVCSDVKIVATSREALRAGGETLYQLGPLDLPDCHPVVTARNAADSAAIRLFVDRALAASGEFRLTDDNAATVCSICKQLDGVPLAIELAAASIATLTLNDISASLDDGRARATDVSCEIELSDLGGQIGVRSP